MIMDSCTVETSRTSMDISGKPSGWMRARCQKRNLNSMATSSDILEYESHLLDADRFICESLRREITSWLPEATSKVWHGHPVWFLDGNPIVGYTKQKWGIQLLFWSGQSFDESWLNNSWKFQAAEKIYTDLKHIDTIELSRWLTKSRDLQWDYANIVKRKGKLERLK